MSKKLNFLLFFFEWYMSFFSIDIEADGPIIGQHSMVCFGAVLVDREGKLDKTFYGKTAPISAQWNPESLAVSGITRGEHEKFHDPKIVMQLFAQWISDNSKGSPIFVSDNNGFDFAWINWYFHNFTGSNPFGYSSRRIGDMYCGLVKDGYAKWKHLRKTKHTHNPVDDAKGNAEALLYMVNNMGLKLNLK